MGWATLSAAANRVAFDRLGSVSVVAGAVSGRGFLAINSEMVLGDQVTIIDFMLEVLTVEFGSLGYGDLVSIDGVSYKTELQPQRHGDGTWCRIPLMKVTPDPAIDYILDGGAALAAGTVYDGGGA